MANVAQHGGGTNSTIFNIQTIRIQRLLSKSFDFVFVDGPFATVAGPDVLPTFDGCGPFLRWAGYSALPHESLDAIESALKGRESDVVGVMGFSQGGKLGAGLLLMQQLRGDDDTYPINFKFGIMLMSTTPPFVSKEFWDRSDEIVTIPTLHVVGKEDIWYQDGLRLFQEHFDRSSSSLLEYDVGHRLPIEQQHNVEIVSRIKILYEKSTGKELVEYKG